MTSARWSAFASTETVPRIRRAVVDFAWAHGIAEPRLSDIGLAISEAVTNAVIHAYPRDAQPGSLHVQASVDGGWIELRVVDDGSGMAPRDDSPGLGLGLPVIHRVADQVEVRTPRGGHGTELRIRFRLDEASVA